MCAFAKGRLAAIPGAAVFLGLSLGSFAQTSDVKGTVKTSATPPGRQLYVQYCVSCHGADATGGGPAASALKVPPSDLTVIARKYKSFPREKVMDWIDGEKYAVGHGSREMPVWGKRFRRAGQTGIPGEVQALASYLESIQKK